MALRALLDETDTTLKRARKTNRRARATINAYHNRRSATYVHAIRHILSAA